MAPALASYGTLNAGQAAAFQRITSALDGTGRRRLFFLQGAAGTGKSPRMRCTHTNHSVSGKTFLYNALIAWCEAQQRTVLPCAATGIAATLLNGGATLHSTFSIPIYIGGREEAKSCKNEEIVRTADLIIVDEISMLSCKVFDYLNKLLKNLSENPEKPFGGRCLVFGGDFHQLSPITGSRKRSAQIDVSIRNHPLFSNKFKVLTLTENMRVDQGEREFAEFLRELGRGATTAKPSIFRFVSSRRKLVRFCYSREELRDPLANSSAWSRCAILAPTRSIVSDLNDCITGMLAGESRLYYSQTLPTNADAPPGTNGD